MTRRWSKMIAMILLILMIFSAVSLPISNSIEAEPLVTTQANLDAIPENTLRIHYQRVDNEFQDMGLWLWGDVTTPSGDVGAWPTGATSLDENQLTDYGVYVDISLKAKANKVNFIVLNKLNEVKDGNEKVVVMTTPEINEIWIKEGSDEVFLWEPVSLPENTVRIHYQKADPDYSNWGLWMWDDVETPSEAVASWPTGATSFSNAQIDKNGAYIDVELKENAGLLSFLVINRIDGAKDGAERSFAQLRDYKHLFIKEGDPAVYTSPYVTAVEDSKANFPDWSKDSTIYEVNVRQYTPEGTFKAFEAHLPRLKELGVEILWFMPIHPISVTNRVGSLGSYYAVDDYQAVNPEFGSLEDFKSLVNTAHEMGFKVMLDWVANHTGWDNQWINNEGWYTTDSEGNVVIPGGTNWQDVADLNFDHADMRNAMIDAMKFWVRETDVDGFRSDYAAGVPQDFWETARMELDQIKPVYMLAEDDTQYGLLSKAFNSNYGWELFYNIMKGIPNGEKGSKDIQSYIERTLQVYPKGSYPMNFITNHDTNSWEGTTSEMFGEAEKTMAILSFMLPGMPLIYSGQEIGLDKRLAFFDKDEINWDDLTMQPFYEKLITLKKQNAALWNGSEGGDVQFLTTDDPRVLAFEREKNGNKVVSVLNLSAENVTTAVYADTAAGTYQSYLHHTSFEINQEQTFNLAPWEYQIFTNNIAAESINVSNQDKLTSIATKGGTLQLAAEVLPANATKKEVTWSIQSGESYASLSDTGLLTAIANGTVIVKATSVSDSSISNTFNVTIQIKETTEVNPIPNTGSIINDVTKPNVEAAKGVVAFKEDSLKNGSGDPVTLTVASDIEQVLLPIHAAELVGKKPIKIKFDKVSIELPTEVLLAAQSLVSGATADKALISLNVTLLQQAAEDALLAMHKDANTNLKMGSAIHKISLSVIMNKNESKNLSPFTKPISISFHVNDGLSHDLAGVYLIKDNQKLEYVGGKRSDGIMTVRVEHLSEFAVLEYEKTFNDVIASHAAYLAIKSLAAKQIVNGTTETNFEPNKSISRAEFAALLVRSLNLKEVGTKGFSDVRGDEWYAGAVTAAAEAGIIKGRNEGVFDPRAQVTKQELDIMLQRANAFKNGNKLADTETLNEPKSLMSRAEAAIAIYLLLNN